MRTLGDAESNATVEIRRCISRKTRSQQNHLEVDSRHQCNLVLVVAKSLPDAKTPTECNPLRMLAQLAHIIGRYDWVHLSQLICSLLPRSPPLPDYGHAKHKTLSTGYLAEMSRVLAVVFRSGGHGVCTIRDRRDRGQACPRSTDPSAKAARSWVLAPI